MWCRKIFIVFIFMLFGLNLTGCVSSRKNMESDQLKVRVSELEKALTEKEEQINSLESELEMFKSENQSRETTTERKSISKMTNKQIQTALKSAGFYSGQIDGKIGKKTTQAIKDFQKSKGLKADGIVGRKTKAELTAYLD